MPSVARRGIAYAIQHVKGMTRWAGAWTLDAGERLRRPPQSGTNALHSSPASRSGTIEYVNPATGGLWDGQGSNPPPRRTRHVYFGLEVIQEYACGGENVFCEAERAMVREFLHGGRGDQVGASTGIFHAPSSDYGTHAQLRYPEAVAMVTYDLMPTEVPYGEPPAPPTSVNPQVYHYLHDVLGSVIGVVNETGTLVERYTLDAGERLCRSPRAGRTRSIRRRVKGTTYDPYGRPFIEKWDAAANEGSSAWVESASECGTGVPACGQMPYSSIGNPFLWTGHRYDAAVGLYHTLFRFYDPTLGRWLQRDPIDYEAGSLNLYEYVLSSPLEWVDSFGLQGTPNPPSSRPPPPGFPENFKLDGMHYTWRNSETHNIADAHYDSKTHRLYVSEDGKMYLQSKKRRSPRVEVGVRQTKRFRGAMSIAGIGSVALVGLMTQYAEALDYFCDPSKSRSCYEWLRAAAKGDCEEMRGNQDRCKGDLTKIGLPAISFDQMADQAYNACIDKKEERRKREEKNGCEKPTSNN